MSRAAVRIRTRIEPQTGIVEFRLVGGPTLKLQLNSLGDAIKRQLMTYGAARKVAQAAQRCASIEAAHEALHNEIARLQAGQWGQRARGVEHSALVQAVAMHHRVDVASAQQHLRTLSKSERRELLTTPSIRAFIEAIRQQSDEGRTRERRADELLAALSNRAAAAA